MPAGIIAKAVIGRVLDRVLRREDVPIENKHVPATVAKIETEVQAELADNNIAVVPVKSGWFSKINWTQVAGPVASLLAAVGLDLSADQIVAVVIAFQTIQSLVTWVIRTWFTHSVTAASVR